MEKAMYVCEGNSLDEMNSLLREGWKTKMAVPQTVATTGTSYNYERGKIFVVLEKE